MRLTYESLKKAKLKEKLWVDKEIIPENGKKLVECVSIKGEQKDLISSYPNVMKLLRNKIATCALAQDGLQVTGTTMKINGNDLNQLVIKMSESNSRINREIGRILRAETKDMPMTVLLL